MVRAQAITIGAFVVLLGTGCGQVADAQQDPGAVPQQYLPQNGGAGLRTGHITSTGETVPNPGASQGAGVTSLDRGIQQEDSKIQGSICKGC
jgi:hypothetical protein